MTTAETSSRRGPIATFWNWWTNELASVVPGAIRSRLRVWASRPALSVSATRYVVELPRSSAAGTRFEPVAEVARTPADPNGEALALRELQAAVEKHVGRGAELVVILDRDLMLHRRLTLPLAVEENVNGAIEFELDRFTPFRPEQVRFDAVVTVRDPQHNQCEVELAVATRQVVDTVIGRLAESGIRVAAVSPPHRPGDVVPDVLPRERAPGRSTTPWVLLALVVLVGLVVTAVAVPIWHKRSVAIAMIDEAARARTQAQAADAVRKQVEQFEADYNFVPGRKFGYPSAIQVIDELTRLLPDDTWLGQLDLRTTGRGKDAVRELSMRGDTSNAGRLISLLEASKLIVDAAPRSPTLKIQPGTGEAFDLGGKLRGLPLPQSVPVLASDGTAVTGTQATGTQGAGTQGAGTQGAGTQGAGTQGAGTQGAGAAPVSASGAAGGPPPAAPVGPASGSGTTAARNVPSPAAAPAPRTTAADAPPRRNGPAPVPPAQAAPAKGVEPPAGLEPAKGAEPARTVIAPKSVAGQQ